MRRKLIKSQSCCTGKEEPVWGDCNSASLLGPALSPSCPRAARKWRLKKQEHAEASIRAKVDHPFRVVKRQFGFMEG